MYENWDKIDDVELVRLLVIAGVRPEKAQEMVEKHDRDQVKVAIDEWLHPNG